MPSRFFNVIPGLTRDPAFPTRCPQKGRGAPDQVRGDEGGSEGIVPAGSLGPQLKDPTPNPSCAREGSRAFPLPRAGAGVRLAERSEA